MSASNPLRTCREVSQSSILFILAYKYKGGNRHWKLQFGIIIQSSLSNLCMYIPAILEIPEWRRGQVSTISRARFLQVWKHTLYDRTEGPKNQNICLLHLYYPKNMCPTYSELLIVWAKISELKCKLRAAAGLLIYQGLATLPINARNLQGKNKPSTYASKTPTVTDNCRMNNWTVRSA